MKIAAALTAFVLAPLLALVMLGGAFITATATAGPAAAAAACLYGNPDLNRIVTSMERLTTEPVDKAHWDQYANRADIDPTQETFEASTAGDRHQVLVAAVSSILATVAPSSVTTPPLVWWNGHTPADDNDNTWQNDPVPGWNGTLETYLTQYTNTYATDPAVIAAATPDPTCTVSTASYTTTCDPPPTTTAATSTPASSAPPTTALSATTSVATTPTTATAPVAPEALTIIGPATMTAAQVTAWWLATRGGQPAVLTTPLATFIDVAYDEAGAEGIRPDMMIAQIVLETGALTNGDSQPAYNNYAGIGHGDNKQHGMSFPTVRDGLRGLAQILHRLATDDTLMLARQPDEGAHWRYNPHTPYWSQLGARPAGVGWSTTPSYWTSLSNVWAAMLAHSGNPSVAACNQPVGTVSGTLANALAWADTQIGHVPYASINPYRFMTTPWPGGTLTGIRGDHYTFPAGQIVADCSGFVIAVWRRAGIDFPGQYSIYGSQGFKTSRLPDAPRTSLQPGDIIVYAPDASGVGHVALVHDVQPDGTPRTIEETASKGIHIGDVQWARIIAIKRPIPVG